jgi:hypothetical protein
MTKDELFFKVVTHLIQQGHQAIQQGHQAKDGGSCFYRAPNGDKCAIGCLIKPELYSPSFEGKAVRFLLGGDNPILKDPELIHLYRETDGLFEELQDLHDEKLEYGVNVNFIDQIRQIAIEYDIDPEHVPVMKIAA